MPQTQQSDTTTVRLKDGTVLRLKGANLSPDEVSDRIAAYRAQMATTPQQLTAPSTSSTPPIPPEVPDNSVLRGFGRRTVDNTLGIITGAYHTIADRPQPNNRVEAFLALYSPGSVQAYRVLRGMGLGEKEALEQAKQYGNVFNKKSDIRRELRTHDIKGALGDYLRYGTTLASMANPLATSSVTNVNDLEDQNRNREAIGQGLSDVLFDVIGLGGTRAAKTVGDIYQAGKTGRALRYMSEASDVSRAKQINKLTAALGTTKETAVNLMPVLDDIRSAYRLVRLGKVSQAVSEALKPFESPEREELTDMAKEHIKEAASESSRSGTVGDLERAMHYVNKQYNMAYNLALAPIMKKMVMPTAIERNLRFAADKLHDGVPAHEAEAREIEDQLDYFRRVSISGGMTVGQLNRARMNANARLDAYYSKDSQAQASAMTHAQTIIEKAIRDGAAEQSYRELEIANPGFKARELKMKQGALWALQDQIRTRIGELTDKEAAQKGMSPLQKIRPRVYGSAEGGVHGFFSGIESMLPGGNPMSMAKSRVSGALDPRYHVARKTVAALPAIKLWVSQPGDLDKKGNQ